MKKFFLLVSVLVYSYCCIAQSCGGNVKCNYDSSWMYRNFLVNGTFTVPRTNFIVPGMPQVTPIHPGAIRYNFSLNLPQWFDSIAAGYRNFVTSPSGSADTVPPFSGTFMIGKGLFTAGSIPFAGSDGKFQQINNNLFYDSTNGRLRVGGRNLNGLGILSVTSRLDTSSSAQQKFISFRDSVGVEHGYISLMRTGNTSSDFIYRSGGTIQFNTNGTTSFTNPGSGNGVISLSQDGSITSTRAMIINGRSNNGIRMDSALHIKLGSTATAPSVTGATVQIAGSASLATAATGTSNYAMLVRDSTTGELRQIAPISTATPTLQQVTTAGATTTNDITINAKLGLNVAPGIYRFYCNGFSRYDGDMDVNGLGVFDSLISAGHFSTAATVTMSNLPNATTSGGTGPYFLFTNGSTDNVQRKDSTALVNSLKQNLQQVTDIGANTTNLVNLNGGAFIDFQTFVNGWFASSITGSTGASENLNIASYLNVCGYSGGMQTFTLPAASTAANRMYIIKNIETINSVTLVGMTVGEHSVLPPLGYIIIFSNSANWYEIGFKPTP